MRCCGVEVPAARLKELGGKLFETVSKPDLPFHTRLQALEETVSAAGVPVPLALDYIMRGLATLKYVWTELSENALWKIAREGLNEASRVSPQLVVQREKVMDLLKHVFKNTEVTDSEVQEAVNKVCAAQGRNAQVAALIESLGDIYRSIGNSKGVVGLIKELRTDQELAKFAKAALGNIDITGLLGEVYAVDHLAASVSGEFAAPDYGLDKVKTWVEANRIGELPEIWNIPLHPGTLLRAKSGNAEEKFYLTIQGPAAEMPTEVRVVELDPSKLDPDDVKKISRLYVNDATERAAKRKGSGEGPGIVTAIPKPSQREAFFRIMNSFDTEGRKVSHVLADSSAQVEYFDGEQWRDLRAQRLC